MPPTLSARLTRNADPKRLFGAVLRQLRLERGLSQEDFAHRMGYHRNYIGQLERGEKSPSLNAIFNFAYGAGLRASEVVRRVEAMSVPASAHATRERQKRTARSRKSIAR